MDNKTPKMPAQAEKKFNEEGKIAKKYYEAELARLHMELVKLQYWVKAKGLRIVVLFEGRDAAGKGGLIKTIHEPLNPRGARVVALDKPNDRERTQWYFQRYVEKLPSAGEIVIFDRSWYNRAGVERVMGYCTEEEYEEFLRSCPLFEQMLVRSGIILLKYWISVSEGEQEERFLERARNPLKRWKLSPIDIASWQKWDDYSRAKDEMFRYTDTRQSPWFCVLSDDKRKARLNCIAHLLSSIPYEDVTPPLIELPPRKKDQTYMRPPLEEVNWIPEIY
ncbi:MAG: polyphosphate kinase 2 [Chloroflexota bacterium]